MIPRRDAYVATHETMTVKYLNLYNYDNVIPSSLLGQRLTLVGSQFELDHLHRANET